jgi:hypothetical protein
MHTARFIHAQLLFHTGLERGRLETCVSFCHAKCSNAVCHTFKAHYNKA